MLLRVGNGTNLPVILDRPTVFVRFAMLSPLSTGWPASIVRITMGPKITPCQVRTQDLGALRKMVPDLDASSTPNAKIANAS
jgi:hypothetical protein